MHLFSVSCYKIVECLPDLYNMDFSALLQAGDARSSIPIVAISAVLSGVLGLQALLITSKKLTTVAKQCLSVPLLTAQILIPMNYTSQNRGMQQVRRL